MAMLWTCPLCHLAHDSQEKFQDHCSKTHPSDAWLWTAVKPEPKAD